MFLNDAVIFLLALGILFSCHPYPLRIEENVYTEMADALARMDVSYALSAYDYSCTSSLCTRNDDTRMQLMSCNVYAGEDTWRPLFQYQVNEVMENAGIYHAVVRKQPELDEGAYYAGFSPRMLTDTYGEPSAVRQTEHFEIWEYDFDLMFRPLVLDKDAIITGHHYRIGTEGITLFPGGEVEYRCQPAMPGLFTASTDSAYLELELPDPEGRVTGDGTQNGVPFIHSILEDPITIRVRNQSDQSICYSGVTVKRNGNRTDYLPVKEASGTAPFSIEEGQEEAFHAVETQGDKRLMITGNHLKQAVLETESDHIEIVHIRYENRMIIADYKVKRAGTVIFCIQGADGLQLAEIYSSYHAH